MQPVLEMKNISKEFPGVKALDSVQFSVIPGEVHCLIGANGAGKSTLMKILAGVYSKDEGDIFLQGKKVDITGPSQSKELGIATIYQELSLIEHLTVAENIFLGTYMKPRYGIMSWKKINEESSKIITRLGIPIQVQKKVSELSAGHKQIVELAKAIASHAKLIVMDEPSTTLSEKEVNTLYRVIEDLKRQGITIIFISHKLEELFTIGDRVTVLRDGKYVATKKLKEISQDELIELIIGHKVEKKKRETSKRTFQELLRVESLSNHKLSNINLQLGKGEIIGLYGLVGSGRTEVLKALYGVDQIKKGSVFIHGNKQKITKPSKAIQLGMGLVPENRKSEGALLHLSVRENAIVASHGHLSKFTVLLRDKVKDVVSKTISELRVKTPTPDTLMMNLSGGNQQKVIISRWLIHNSEILLFDEPTQGIDVGAKDEIYRVMREVASQGKGIIVVSSEINELLEVCNRILVMYDGKIVGEFDDPQNQKEEILHLAVKGGDNVESSKCRKTPVD
ncbi:sugar ABC transporter ATP-binding protein [Aneurinibacillus terranovensis]|uniref:sugar ABC transporter ATP-binding protein n=1 Tax=Aneurinibacillus terranovensis TaxID=278991 RepID=UPI0003FEC33F|nr:sugar ABC transporter ATP-binding protein [Aneurinibacillus terranovensis]